MNKKTADAYASEAVNQYRQLRNQLKVEQLNEYASMVYKEYKEACLAHFQEFKLVYPHSFEQFLNERTTAAEVLTVSEASEPDSGLRYIGDNVVLEHPRVPTSSERYAEMEEQSMIEENSFMTHRLQGKIGPDERVFQIFRDLNDEGDMEVDTFDLVGRVTTYKFNAQLQLID